ncbi:MAG: helix-turn-helix transcriptional regulator [Bacteroidetes bacterium]|uniref:Helix-turn-helix transcriptional regulator n=1 Tax=Candidatus Cryptobacteroides intestinigallinarum TaxID=2840767 RepID=A0A9D9HLI8_9BACT|nr:helix-turn-helix transcriptional regulator [Candidatus Cryptobacteroides intestinigallinarum]
MNTDSAKGNILKHRKEAGLSQEEMAEKIGISRTAYRNIETGKTRLISRNAEKMASILGISTEELLFGSDRENTADTLSDIKASYDTRIKDIESGHTAEEARLRSQIKFLEEYIAALKETVRTKDEVIGMLKKTLAGESKG